KGENDEGRTDTREVYAKMRDPKGELKDLPAQPRGGVYNPDDPSMPAAVEQVLSWETSAVRRIEQITFGKEEAISHRNMVKPLVSLRGQAAKKDGAKQGAGGQFEMKKPDGPGGIPDMKKPDGLPGGIPDKFGGNKGGDKVEA